MWIHFNILRGFSWKIQTLSILHYNFYFKWEISVPNSLHISLVVGECLGPFQTIQTSKIFKYRPVEGITPNYLFWNFIDYSYSNWSLVGQRCLHIYTCLYTQVYRGYIMGGFVYDFYQETNTSGNYWVLSCTQPLFLQ